MILSALEDYPDGFILKQILCLDSSRTASPVDISVRQRAAKALAKAGHCRLARVWGSNRLGNKAPVIAVLRSDAPDPANIAKTGYEHDQTSGGSAWSDKMVARRLGVSHGNVASVRRQVSVEPGQFPRDQHFGAGHNVSVRLCRPDRNAVQRQICSGPP